MVAAAVSGLLLRWALQSEAVVEQKTQAATGYYTDRADIAAERRCLMLPAPAQAQCIAEERYADRPDQRGEYDLEAQRRMAVWTRYMGIAAIIGMGVGMFGVGLVFVTFRETRRAAEAGFEANEIARQSAERQLRAYVTLEGIQKLISKADEDSPMSLNAVWKNAGATPAHNAASAISYADFDENGMPEDFDFPDQKSIHRQSMSLGPGIVTDSEGVEIPRWLIDAVKLGSRTVFVWGWIEYDDVFQDTPRRRSEFSVEIVADTWDDDFGVTTVATRRFNGCDEHCEHHPKT